MHDEDDATRERTRPRQRRRRSGPRTVFRRLRRLLLPRDTGARLRLTLLGLAAVSAVYLVRNAPSSPTLGPATPALPADGRADAASGSSPVDENVVVRRIDAPSAPAPATSSADEGSVADARGVSLEALRERGVAFERPVAHELGEGDSLWRLLRRVVTDDAVLLDRLVDQLAASGMRVDAVRAGREVVVDGGAADGRRLRIDDGDTVYVGRVDGRRVTTAAHRIATVPLGAAPRRDVRASTLPESVIDALLDPYGPWRAALDAPSPGRRLDLLLVTTRAPDTLGATTRIAALSTAERTITAEDDSAGSGIGNP